MAVCSFDDEVMVTTANTHHSMPLTRVRSNQDRFCPCLMRHRLASDGTTTTFLACTATAVQLPLCWDAATCEHAMLITETMHAPARSATELCSPEINNTEASELGMLLCSHQRLLEPEHPRSGCWRKFMQCANMKHTHHYPLGQPPP